MPIIMCAICKERADHCHWSWHTPKDARYTRRVLNIECHGTQATVVLPEMFIHFFLREIERNVQAITVFGDNEITFWPPLHFESWRRL